MSHDDPTSVHQVTLNLTLDASFVPTLPSGSRLDRANLVVLDNFITSEDREELLAWLTGHNWDGPHPPLDKWERATCDGANLPQTWGLKASPLLPLQASPAMLQFLLGCHLLRMSSSAHSWSARSEPSWSFSRGSASFFPTPPLCTCRRMICSPGERLPKEKRVMMKFEVTKMCRQLRSRRSGPQPCQAETPARRMATLHHLLEAAR